MSSKLLHANNSMNCVAKQSKLNWGKPAKGQINLVSGNVDSVWKVSHVCFSQIKIIYTENSMENRTWFEYGNSVGLRLQNFEYLCSETKK